jgi:hypothetical protein
MTNIKIWISIQILHNEYKSYSLHEVMFWIINNAVSLYMSIIDDNIPFFSIMVDNGP